MILDDPHRIFFVGILIDADPYSSARGVFFSHIGWVFVEKHPDVIRKGKRIDMSDLESDPIIMFQER